MLWSCKVAVIIPLASILKRGDSYLELSLGSVLDTCPSLYSWSGQHLYRNQSAGLRNLYPQSMFPMKASALQK